MLKRINVEDAIGMKLSHDITTMYEGFKGAKFKRGHVIEEKDIEELLKIGKRTVYILEQNDDEIHEEDAAYRLSQMNILNYAHYTDVSEGKILLIADIEGMFFVDVELQKQINSIKDITISTLPNHYHVNKGDRLVSIRIVPLVTNIDNIIKAESICKNKILYNLYPFNQKKVSIIITGSEIYNGLIKDKFEPVCRTKLFKYPAEIIDVIFCDDDVKMIETAIKNSIDKGADLIIWSGGMSVDPDDLTPTAIKNIGADILTHGVPSQPGNMTLVAYKNNITILGIPGAAISLPTTIFDVLLPQVFSDIKFTKSDLINLGNGGLCQMCKICHFPNCTFGRY